MIIYTPAGKNQKETKIRTTTSEYKKWLTQHGDTLRILNLRRGDPANKPRGEDPNAVYYSPCVEVYKNGQKDHFHFIGANKEERLVLEKWLSSFYVAKNGYIRILDKRRK
jgi:hypothetical protein